MRRGSRWFVVPALIGLLNIPAAADDFSIELTPIGTYATGIFNRGAAEIVAHDPEKQRLFVVNGANASIDVLSIKNPTAPTLLFAIPVSPYGHQANSVEVYGKIVAAAVENVVKTDPGKVVFFDTDGNFLSAVTVGSLPDMITFTPDGKKVLVANESEPNEAYTIDPEGSVSIIDISRGAAKVTQKDVITANFRAFNNAILDPSIRIIGPNATAAQDLEPEYITVASNSKEAWVTLEENNEIGVLDLKRGIFTKLLGLGFKDRTVPGDGMDASDRDNAINIANWPVHGMFQPDAIANFRFSGETFLVTANEGEARAYLGFNEEVRVKDLTLDPVVFPNAAALKQDAALGRLRVTNANGDPNHDGDFDALFAFGARSFSIWTTAGDLVYDSGDDLERQTAAALPADFNCNNDANNSFDTRSDDKGPEPEGITLGQISGHTYAFVGLERIGGVMVYEVTNPFAPKFVQYVNNRNFAGNPAAGTAGDLGPEGLHFIEGKKSPNENPLLVANEISGTTTIFQISRRFQ